MTNAFPTKLKFNIIFGGLLDGCIPDPRRAEVFTTGYIQNSEKIDGFTYLKLISNIKNTNYISSLPVRVCFCTPDDQPDCGYKPPTVHVQKGQNFNVSLVAVDQVNHTLENITIHSYFDNTESSLGEDQSIQVTENYCTNLTFSVHSPNNFEQLIVYAKGPCKNTKRSQSRIFVKFEPCKCPKGFQNQSNHEESDCVCVCNERLSPYFTEEKHSCNFQTELLVRQGNFWIDFIHDKNKNSSGYLKHPYCPLDYCLPPTSNVFINLNLINGADAQCANNRSGLLCAVCQSGLSLSLGSSRCILCSKIQYIGYVPVILITLIAGILLVALLMTLNLTVATGTLNGLIFYANAVSANASTFFAGLSLSMKYYSILISWFNLEVGLDVCFFDGMDTYWKTWLQLAFPVYIIVLVAVIIIINEWSMKFSRLIDKANPVAF